MANGTVKKFLYPAVAIGAWQGGRVQWSGPSSYTQVTTGIPPTGGDQLPATDFGIGFVHDVHPAPSQDGAFLVVPLVPFGGKTIILKWMALKTATIGGQAQTSGTEVAAGTDLSAFYVNLTAFQLT